MPGVQIVKSGRYCNVGKFALICNDASKAQQHKKKECDINRIMDKYAKTGILGNPYDMKNARKPIFADFTMQGDYHAMLNTITNANKAFMSLPPQLRQKFENDPKKAMDFVSDRANTMEAVRLGLVPKSVLPRLVVDPVDPAKRIYVDKNGNSCDPVPGQLSLDEINKKSEAK